MGCSGLGDGEASAAADSVEALSSLGAAALRPFFFTTSTSSLFAGKQISFINSTELESLTVLVFIYFYRFG
jgi:hypothetical protein